MERNPLDRGVRFVFWMMDAVGLAFDGLDWLVRRGQHAKCYSCGTLQSILRKRVSLRGLMIGGGACHRCLLDLNSDGSARTLNRTVHVMGKFSLRSAAIATIGFTVMLWQTIGGRR